MYFSVNSLLPKLPLRPGISLVTVNIIKIGLKNASDLIDPFFVVSCKGENNNYQYFSCTCGSTVMIAGHWNSV